MSTSAGPIPDPLSHPLLQGLPSSHGFRVAPPCVLTQHLGEGAVGVVYRGVHLNLEIDVAVKFLRPEVAKEREHVSRFLREARIAASIRHENLVSVYDTVARHGHYYTVMELVEGETLHDRVVRKGPLAPAEALTLIAASLRGLAALHRRDVIHRDVKPTNIIVSSAGDVKLSDLGIARDALRSADTLKTHADALIGTPQYMAPEQFRSADLVTARSDVFSMGATLAFLLLGDHAIKGSSIAEVMHNICNAPFPPLEVLRPDLPKGVVEIVRAATQPRVEDRPTARQMLDAITRELHATGPGEASLEDADARPQPSTLAAPLPTRLDRTAMREIASEIERLPSGGTGGASIDLPRTLKEGGPAGRRPAILVASGVAILAATAALAWWQFGRPAEPIARVDPSTAPSATPTAPIQPVIDVQKSPPEPAAVASPLPPVPKDVTDERQRQRWTDARTLLADAAMQTSDVTRGVVLTQATALLWFLVEDRTIESRPLLMAAGRAAIDAKDGSLAAEVLVRLRHLGADLVDDAGVRDLLARLDEASNAGYARIVSLDRPVDRLELLVQVDRLQKLRPTLFYTADLWDEARRSLVAPFHRVLGTKGLPHLYFLYKSWINGTDLPSLDAPRVAEMLLRRAEVLTREWRVDGARAGDAIADCTRGLDVANLPVAINAGLTLQRGIAYDQRGELEKALRDLDLVAGVMVDVPADLKARALARRSVVNERAGKALESIQDAAAARAMLNDLSDEARKDVEATLSGG